MINKCGKCAKFKTEKCALDKTVKEYRKSCKHFQPIEKIITNIFDVQCMNSSHGIYVEYNTRKSNCLTLEIYGEYDSVVLSREDSVAMANAILQHYNELDLRETKEKIDF